MKLLTNIIASERYEMNWCLLLTQGIVIGLIGFTFGFASLFSPNAIVLNAKEFSWLPMCGIVILSLGILECLDAVLAKEMRDFLQNLQVGVLDMVVGAVLILSISGKPERLNLLIVAYLLVRGVVRITLVNTLKLPNALSTSIGGLMSIVLGLLIMAEWPTSAAWFLAFSLNAEIACRGWAIMMFALWVRQSAQRVEDSQ